jgi:hypothetical protein
MQPPSWLLTASVTQFGAAMNNFDMEAWDKFFAAAVIATATVAAAKSEHPDMTGNTGDSVVNRAATLADAMLRARKERYSK